MFRKKRRQIGLADLSIIAFTIVLGMFHNIIPPPGSLLIAIAGLIVYLILRNKETHGGEDDQAIKR